MSCLLSLTDEDQAALDYASIAANISRTGLVRRLVWAYAKGRINCPGVPSLRKNPFPETPRATDPR